MHRFAAPLSFAVVSLSLLLAACGGGGGDDGDDSGGGPAGASGGGGGARAMAAAMETELATLKDCYQGEKDGKGACEQDLLRNRVTILCSDVRTGKANEFAVGKYTDFEPICATWTSLLSTPAAQRPDAITGMIDKLKAIN